MKVVLFSCSEYEARNYGLLSNSHVRIASDMPFQVDSSLAF